MTWDTKFWNALDNLAMQSIIKPIKIIDFID